jgi:hypothetical protein
MEAKSTPINAKRSELSKSSLLLSKIGLTRGEIRNAFGNVQEAIEILRSAIVKKE